LEISIGHSKLTFNTKDADLVLYCITGPNPTWRDKRFGSGPTRVKNEIRARVLGL